MGLRDLVLVVGVRAIRVCSYLVSIIMIFIVLSLHCSPKEATTSLPSMLAMHLRLCHDCIDSIRRDVLHGNCRGFGGTFRILFYCPLSFQTFFSHFKSIGSCDKVPL